ncbi:hypothetical protein SNE40_008952 [Patella caerulea]|uniref:Peptidase aspartic putative domain-containing protein n=1 Tax=Patella caerulea TaxID=87958 RepID=A0AAN8PRC4_PATCE
MKSGCEMNHQPLLHEDHSRSTQANSSSSSINSAGCCQLPVVKVHVQDDYGVTHEAIAMIDSGSQQSLIRKSFANKLRLRGSQPQDIHIRSAGGCEMFEKSKIYALKISDVNNSQVYELTASSLETVCGDIPPIENHNLSLYPHLSGLLDLIYCDCRKVDLLIGTNFPTAFKDLGSCCISDENAPIAKQTPLGCVLLGELGQQSLLWIHRILPHFLKLIAESAFIGSLKSNTKFLPDGRIQMKMPWKPGHPSFPDNRPMTMKRLCSLEKHLIQSNKVEQYNQG